MTITQYQVQYRTDDTTSWSSCPPVSGSPPANFTVVNGMNTNSKYKVRVRARSAVGVGQWSEEYPIGSELCALLNAQHCTNTICLFFAIVCVHLPVPFHAFFSYFTCSDNQFVCGLAGLRFTLYYATIL